MLTQLPKTYCSQFLADTKSVQDRLNCLFCIYVYCGLVPIWIDVFRWQCPVSSPVSILSWFWPRPNSSLALLAEVHLRKPSACLCPRMDCQYSLCFLLVQPLISPVVTYANTGMTGWGTLMDMRNVAWQIWGHWYCFSKIHLHTANHMARQEWEHQHV